MAIQGTRSFQHVDELIELAREYCSRLAAFRSARHRGLLSKEEDAVALAELAELDARIERLKRREPAPKHAPARRHSARSTVRLRRIIRRLTR